MKHPPGDKGEPSTHRNAKESLALENPKAEDIPGDAGSCSLEPPCSPEGLALEPAERLLPVQSGTPEASESKRKDFGVPEQLAEQPRVTLLQSSKDRLRRRLKDKAPVSGFSLLSALGRPGRGEHMSRWAPGTWLALISGTSPSNLFKDLGEMGEVQGRPDSP